MKKTGLVHIYTGDGKGKTTAACGLAVRAASHGMHVGFFRFFKPVSGECAVLQSLPTITLRSFCPRHPGCQKMTGEEMETLRRHVAKAWETVTREIASTSFDLIILDEIIIAVRDNYLPETEIIRLMKTKPNQTELVLTGRGCTKKIRAKADLITEMKEGKHPFPAVKARKGIEY